MRPVQRRRSQRAIQRYSDARDLLMDRLGDYCSYCERPTSYAIEHVLPWEDTITHRQHPRLEKSWTNFLLTCVKCNNYKAKRQDATPYGQRRLARRRYYWPDTDNTFRAFEYVRTGDVTAHRSLSAPEQTKATDMIHMFGFNAPNDIRRRKRADVWMVAELHLQSWLTSPTPHMLNTIALSAREAGCWSVWRTVFAAHPQVLAHLDRVFPGTALSNFDPHTGVPLPRHKGQL